MYFDDVSQSVMRELARIHKRKMAPLKKALESAIVRAAKTDCWYDPWNRKGLRVDDVVVVCPKPQSLFVVEYGKAQIAVAEIGVSEIVE